MRDFFIRAFEMILGAFILLGLAATVIFAIFVAMTEGGSQGTLSAIGIFLGGTLYMLFLGGAMYMGLGIYHNTKRMAEAIDRSSQGSGLITSR